MRVSHLVLFFIGNLLSGHLLAFHQLPPAQVDKPIIHQIYQLVDQRNPISPVFQQALAHSDADVQKTALLGLARIGGKPVINQLVPFLNHADESFRQLAAFGLGISANKEAAYYLWQQLEKETAQRVKQEIYLGLGNLGQNNLNSKMMKRLDLEQSAESRAHLFQGLAIALTFHRDLQDNYDNIDYAKILAIFSQGDEQSAMAGYFLNRVPDIGKTLSADDLLKISQGKLSTSAKINLARLISKVTENEHPKNRELLAWVIESSESEDLNLQLAAIRAYKNLTNIPQTLIQLGKFQASSNPIVAHTALNVLAESKLDSEEVIRLFKKQLKSENEALVTQAVAGLLKRQTREEMSWMLTFLRHPSTFVQINLISQLKNKSDTDFDNFIRKFTQSPNQEVADYARSRLEKQPVAKESTAQSPSYAEALTAAGKQVTLKTSQGDIVIQLLADAPYTAWHFINNAQQGYFTNSYFSRVIGNFVAQGGDTIGDLQGSSGKTIREEINFLAHEHMTVGMATAGKDTGSSQFFINTARNPHLDRNYTVFGKVIRGQNLVMKMTNGLKVLSVEVR